MKYLIIYLMILETVFGGVIKPEAARQYREILTISGNRSSYYLLKNESLIYKVKGPQRIKIYSRSVQSRKGSEAKTYGFEIQLNGNQPLQVAHHQKLSRSVKSAAHPNHYYTKFAKDYISIPAGVNEVVLRPKKHAGPVLIRVLEDKQAPKGKKSRVDALSESAPVKLISNKHSLSYYALQKGHPLYVTLEGPLDLEITSRLGFDPQMGREEDYRVQVLDNGKVVGTYYFSTGRSEETVIEGQNAVVPGKWRSCDVKLNKGVHEMKLRLLDEDRQVFIKLNQINGK